MIPDLVSSRLRYESGKHRSKVCISAEERALSQPRVCEPCRTALSLHYPHRPGGGIGRHGGLKPPWLERVVRVQVPPRAPDEVGQVMDRFAPDHHSCQLMVERMARSKSSNDIDDFALRIRFASAPTTVRNGASGSVMAKAIASATA